MHKKDESCEPSSEASWGRNYQECEKARNKDTRWLEKLWSVEREGRMSEKL